MLPVDPGVGDSHDHALTGEPEIPDRRGVDDIQARFDRGLGQRRDPGVLSLREGHADRAVRGDQSDVVARSEFLGERAVGFDRDHVDEVKRLKPRAGAGEASEERALRGVGGRSEGLVDELLPFGAGRDVRRPGQVGLPMQHDEDRGGLIRTLSRENRVEDRRVRREKREGQESQNEDREQALRTGHGTRVTHRTDKLCPSTPSIAELPISGCGGRRQGRSLTTIVG